MYTCVLTTKDGTVLTEDKGIPTLTEMEGVCQRTVHNKYFLSAQEDSQIHLVQRL